MISWRRPTRLAFVAAFLAGANMMVSPASAEDTIKIGVLHSLSGTMAISETTLKDTILMMVDELNASGGLLDKTVEAVVVDPASNWPLFAEKARELIEKNEVAVVFGCWTSVVGWLVGRFGYLVVGSFEINFCFFVRNDNVFFDFFCTF